VWHASHLLDHTTWFCTRHSEAKLPSMSVISYWGQIARHSLTHSTCTAGRRKKKKCNGYLPQCGLCRHSYGRDECKWPSIRQTRKPQKDAPECSTLESEQLATSTSNTPAASDLPAPCEVILKLPDELLRALP
jgi:hypothetical protein